MPITKDLQSKPVVPTIEEADSLDDESDFDELQNKKDKKKAEETEETVEENTENAEEENDEETTEEKTDDSKEEIAEPKEKEEEKSDKKADKKAKKEKKAKNKEANWFIKHRKWFFIGGPIAVVLVAVLVWALVIAPAVDVKVKVRTKVEKFSENITFTTNLEEEDIASGKFFLEEKKVETPNSVKFTATGKKNVGEKAKGNVIVYAYFKENGVIAINAGSSFTSQNLTYYSDSDITFGWDGKNVSECGNNGDASLVTSGCLIYARVNVTAAAPGSEYNIAQNNSWTTAANAGVYSDASMTGGTDRTITVVQESDITTAKESLASGKEEETKNQLFEGISEDSLKIDSSFKLTTAELVSTPAVGEEVGEGVEPTLSTTITASIQVVDLTKIREFITTKAKIPEKEHVYAIGNPFIENFTTIENGYAGRLKTNYTYGATFTEQGIINLIKGQRFGNVGTILRDEGASDVEINRSYPWVTSVPTDTNKITVTIKEE
jgi:hypothetical protein